MKAAIVLALSVAAASSAAAQTIPVPRQARRAPSAWVSLSAGFMRLDGIYDGTTDAVWDFGSALQYRGTFEVDVSRGASFGVSFGMADVPLTYFGGGIGLPGTCATGCDAHAKVWSTGALFHMGGGVGFHQVIDLGIGASIYRDFEADDGGDLPPESPDKDFSFTFGYGFGYGLTPRTQIILVQDASYVLHQREGLRGGDDASSQHFVTRIGLRVGLGGW